MDASNYVFEYSDQRLTDQLVYIYIGFNEWAAVVTFKM
ncbi:hypothetical protein XM79_c21271 [Vibrio vulnificus]|nr:hypothetical protein XM78_c21288 [Vibrio vulnificus]OQK61787.1 hypothetical protein XM79_c21271 [Vibrio vulnificus]TCN04646.1 hypothetical protein EDB35_12216 [Vibrio crassostreae]TCU06774.1 hypothetical protein EDB32_113134 [Vibrio crassostreae]